MKTLSLSKTLNFKRAFIAATLVATAFAYAAPQRAAASPVEESTSGVSLDDHVFTPGTDFSSILFAENPTCKSSVLDVAAKVASCRLKTEAKAAKRGIEPNFAACEAKAARWAKKSQKACCSDYAYDQVAHEECAAAVDITVFDAGTGSCDGGDSEGGGPTILATRYALGNLCENENNELRSFRDMEDEYNCCVNTDGCEVEASWNAVEMCSEMSCDCGEAIWGNTADQAYEECVTKAGGEVIIAPGQTAADPAGM